MRIKRILLPIDFSRFSLRALDYAIDFARPHHAELVLIHVIEPMPHVSPFVPEPTTLLDKQRQLAAAQLSRLETNVRARYRKCRSEIHLGVVYATIVEVAKALKADMIVIATHGRTGLAHVLIGSVAERVVRSATCPVLTVRSVIPRPRKGRRGRASEKTA